MARGQAQAADKQIGANTALTQGAVGANANIMGQIGGPLSNELNNPGYDDATKAGITTATLGSEAAGFDTARQNASSRAARTRNAAGQGELLDDLARQQAESGAELSGGLTKGFADKRTADIQDALNRYAQLYGINVGEIGNLAHASASDLSARAGGGPGFSWGLGLGPLSVGGH